MLLEKSSRRGKTINTGKYLTEPTTRPGRNAKHRSVTWIILGNEFPVSKFITRTSKARNSMFQWNFKQVFIHMNTGLGILKKFLGILKSSLLYFTGIRSAEKLCPRPMHHNLLKAYVNNGWSKFLTRLTNEEAYIISENRSSSVQKVTGKLYNHW